MVFHSIDFLIFFIIVVGIYYWLPHTKRWLLLLVASYTFYMWWKPAYAVLILLSTTIDYFAAINIGSAQSKAKKKYWLWASLFVNLGLLGTFKYFNFFIDNIEAIITFTGASTNFPRLDWLLPVGISFYTFQTLSYTIDVYRSQITPEKHFGIFAVYVSFFPQLVAGPIERASRLIPQLKLKTVWNAENIKYGVLLTLWGFFKKLVIADRLAVYVDKVYAQPELFDGGFSLLASYAFVWQVYCDFSAYSDIAVGIAAILGVELMHNFKRPFFSTSLRELYTRWHVSLMLWLRDYIYRPLNDTQKPSRYFNLFLVFLLSGIWHGAAWTFITWGIFSGVLIIIWRWMKDTDWIPNVKNRFVLRLYTFHAFMFSTIFFRANDLDDAIVIINKIFSTDYKLQLSNFTILDSLFEMSIALIAICLLYIIELKQERGWDFSHLVNKYTCTTYYIWVYGLILCIVLFGWFGGSAFVYFQF
jgi:D-alanyl-lipoteichoic acid acyltransferase DltB (MBOAT superfamily)